MKSSIYILSVLFLVFGCTISDTKNNDRALAQVGLRFLYVSELSQNMPKYTDPSDSALFAQEYITNWIKQQLLLAEAEQKLSFQNKDVMAEIERYRQDLIIYKYKTSRINDVINQRISFDEIENYYNLNTDKFVIDRVIVRVTYMIFPLEISPPTRIKAQAASNIPDDFGEVEEYLFKYAKKYDSFNDEWLYLDNLLGNVNYTLDDPTQFLRKNKWIEFTRNRQKHIIAIKQYMLPGQTAPIDFVSNQIMNNIINERKLDFLREIKDSLYSDALKYNKFRLFN